VKRSIGLNYFTESGAYSKWVRYLKNQVIKLGVEIRLGKEVNKSLIREINPDLLIISTGGIHNVPDLPGINKRNVITSKALHRQLKGYMRIYTPKVIRSLTNLRMPIGKRVAIVGGNIQGCQTAEFLVRRGRKVTIVDTADEIGNGLLEAFVKPYLLDWPNKTKSIHLPQKALSLWAAAFLSNGAIWFSIWRL